ncbi:hypothetical protein CF319_g6253 [Tilletia indica]|nr:hypothetical protein CF319_g6253 [Tilletia indica]
MRVIDTLLLAAAALSSSSLVLAAPPSGPVLFNNIIITPTPSVVKRAPPSGPVVFNNIILTPTPSVVKRNEVRDIVGTIRSKQTRGSDFCSTFLHVPPYAATTTRTITKTVSATTPSSTLVKTASITNTASPATKFSTKISVVNVTPTSTVVQTVATVIPITSTVTTVTSFVTATTAVTKTVTTFTALAERRDQNVPIPYWLKPHRSASISRACSHIVVPKTKTNTRTVTTTQIVKNGVKTTTVIPSSSLVPVTATVVKTTVVAVTSTAAITRPSPTVKGRIKAFNANGTFFGYFGPVSDQYGATTITSNVNDSLVVNIPPPSRGSNGLVNIVNPINSSFPFLGPVMGADKRNGINGTNSIGPAFFYNYLILGNVNKVNKGTQSSDKTGNSITAAAEGKPAVYESQVWSYDINTGSLKLTWTNSDGSSVYNPTLIAFQSGGVTFLEFTGDAAAYRDRYNGFTSQNLNLIVELNGK